MVWCISEKMRDYLTDVVEKQVKLKLVFPKEVKDEFIKMGGDWKILETCLYFNIIVDGESTFIDFDSAFRAYDDAVFDLEINCIDEEAILENAYGEGLDEGEAR